MNKLLIIFSIVFFSLFGASKADAQISCSQSGLLVATPLQTVSSAVLNTVSTGCYNWRVVENFLAQPVGCSASLTFGGYASTGTNPATAQQTGNLVTFSTDLIDGSNPFTPVANVGLAGNTFGVRSGGYPFVQLVLTSTDSTNTCYVQYQLWGATSVSPAAGGPSSGSGGSGTVTSVTCGTNLTGGTFTINGTCGVNLSIVPQKFIGTAAPGTVAGNLPGDTFTDSTNGNAYICDKPSATAAPACTAVGAGNWLLLNGVSSSFAISSLTNATGANTISNANFGQQWNWTLTGGGAGLLIADSIPSTGAGSYLLEIGASTGSTAIPLGLYSNLSGSQTLPTLSIFPTWNTTGVVDAAFLINVTNTASGANSLLEDLQIGGTSEWRVDKGGNVIQAGNISLAAGVGLLTSNTLSLNSGAITLNTIVGWSSGSEKALGNISSTSGAAADFQGGANATSFVNIKSTTATGTTDFIKFTVGTNGGTEAFRVLHSGGVSFGSTSDPGVRNIGFAGAPVSIGGTQFTVSGCGANTLVGNASAGSFLVTTTGACTAVITIAGATGDTAPNGWSCDGKDVTTANLITQSGVSQTTCTLVGTTVNGDKIVFSTIGF